MVNNTQKYECFKKWCAIPFIEKIEALELGDEKDIPVKSTGPYDQDYDQDKAKRVTKADLDFGDPNVPVSQFVLLANALWLCQGYVNDRNTDDLWRSHGGERDVCFC